MYATCGLWTMQSGSKISKTIQTCTTITYVFSQCIPKRSSFDNKKDEVPCRSIASYFKQRNYWSQTTGINKGQPGCLLLEQINKLDLRCSFPSKNFIRLVFGSTSKISGYQANIGRLFVISRENQKAGTTGVPSMCYVRGSTIIISQFTGKSSCCV